MSTGFSYFFQEQALLLPTYIAVVLLLSPIFIYWIHCSIKESHFLHRPWVSTSKCYDSSSSPKTTADKSLLTKTRQGIFRIVLSITQLLLWVYTIQGELQRHEITQIKLSDLSLISHAALWIYLLILEIAKIFIAKRNTRIFKVVCNHLHFLHITSIVINIVSVQPNFFWGISQDQLCKYGFFAASSTITFIIILALGERHDSVFLKLYNFLYSFYSKFLFGWANTIMERGHRYTLYNSDLPNLSSPNLTEDVLSIYNENTKSKSISATLFKAFRFEFFVQLMYCCSWCTLMFGSPYFLNQIVAFTEDPNEKQTYKAFLYVFGLFVSNSIQSLCLQQALHIGRTLSARVQSVLVGKIFSKSLYCRDQSGTQTEKSNDANSSSIDSLLAVDAQKVVEMTAHFFYVYSFPIQIIASVYGLYRLLGNAALWGVLVMILCQPLTYFLGRRFEGSHGHVMTATDKRLKLINEMLPAIRAIKYFSWEDEFIKRINELREKELGAIHSRFMMFTWIISAWFLIPIAIMVTVFYTFTLSNELTAAIAFTAISLFNTFRAALDEFPLLLTLLIQANSSLKRIEKFLEKEEADSLQNSHACDTSIGFADNASFTWGSSGQDKHSPVLKNLNISFPIGKLSIICGSTGSGKTALLKSLLGETHRISGKILLPKYSSESGKCEEKTISSIAYVAQSAWLQNNSIRDNILFGSLYDNERYQEVVYLTALAQDLEALELGDQTVVGERGIALSGGQKQRVSIARAIYSQTEVIVLDDCLSAVDSHTAKHIYTKLLSSYVMKGRTIILATHFVGLCINGADYVVVLKDGEVSGLGHPRDVMKHGALDEHLSLKEKDNINGSVKCFDISTFDTALQKPIKQMHKKESQRSYQKEETEKKKISWSVYKTYYVASGGAYFWMPILTLLCLAQCTLLGQDYWIKIWSAAYNKPLDLAKITVAEPCSNSSYFSIVRIGMDLVTAYMESFIQKQMIKNPKSEGVNTNYYIFVYFLIGLFAAILNCIRTRLFFVGTLNASRRIHNMLTRRILHAKIRFYDTTPVGHIISRFSSDMTAIDQELGPSLSFLMYSIIAALSFVVLVSNVTPIFLLPGAVITLAFLTVSSYFLKTSRDIKHLNSSSQSAMFVFSSECVAGAATIRSFGDQRRFIKEGYKKIDDNNRSLIFLWVANRWLHCRVDMLGALICFCTGFGLVLAHDRIDPGLAGLCLSYSLSFTHQVLWAVRNYAANETNMSAIERIQEHLSIEEEAYEESVQKTIDSQWPKNGNIKVDRLVIQYTPDSPHVLCDVNFSVNSCEKVGIVGRTGSGKSTLALSFFRFVEPTEGTIYIDGVDIRNIGLKKLRSNLTIIPQDPILFSGTVRSNLDPLHEYSDAELSAALKRVNLATEEPKDSDILESIVLESGSNWSQGQRQLIALARALVKKSSLIIMDEATSSIDFDTDQKIQKAIRSEISKSTLLCIAHRIRTVINYDRILVLDRGKVVEYDTPCALLAKEDGVFYQMCRQSNEFSELLNAAKKKKATAF